MTPLGFPRLFLRKAALAVFVFAVALHPSTRAAIQTWSGSTNGNWVTSTNWMGGAVPGSTASLVNTDTATFNNAGNGNTTITIDPNRNLRSLTFDTSAVSYTIGSAGANGGNSLLLSSAGSITIAGTIAGTGLTQTINAPLILEPVATGTSGAYTFTNASPDASNRLVIAGNVSAGTITGTQTLTLSGVNTGNNIVSGAISDGGASGGLAVAKAGTGVWILSGANTYTGSTSIASSGGMLVGIGEHAFGSTSGISINGSSSVLSLRGDTSTSFTKESDNSLYAVTSLSSAVTINVDQATVAGTSAKTMTIGTLTIASTAAGFIQNFTGSNNTSLSLGAVLGGVSTASGSTTFTNNIVGGGTLTLAGYTSRNTSGGEIVRFNGAGTTFVTDSITPSTTVLGLAKLDAGTLVLSGLGSTYTGATSVASGGGTLVGIGAHAFGSTSGIALNGSTVILSLLGDTSTSFTKASDSSAYAVTLGASGATINVDQATVAGTGAKTMTIGTLALNNASSNITNFTGANNTSLGVGAVSSGTSTTNQTITNSITGGGSLTLASFTSGRISGTETLIFNGVGNTTVTGAITQGAATLALTKDGTGTLTLSGSNTYTGATTISGGILATSAADRIADASSVSISAGAIFQIGGAETVGGLTGSGTVALGGNTLAVESSAANTFSGIIGGSGGLTKGGTGNLTLSGANTYTGTTTVSSGTLSYGVNNALADASVINVDGGALNMATFSGTVAGVRLANGLIAGTTGILTSTTAYDVQSGTVSAILGGSVGLTKSTSGTLTLSGSNTYTGTTTISGGVLATSAANRIADASVVDISGAGATLQIGGAETIGGLLGTGTVALGANTLTVSTAATGTYGGVIGGSGGLTKSGTGLLALTGSNTYTGLTTLAGGTLTLDFSATATAPASNIIASTGTLSLNTGGSAGSATLSLIGKDGGASSQSFATNAMPVGTGGAFHINLTPGAGGTLTLNTGTMPARAQGNTLDFGLAGGATVTTTTGTGANGLIVGLATINGSDFATVNSGTVVAFSNYVNNTATTLGAQSQVVDMTGGNTTVSGTGATNNGVAIRFNTLGSTTITLAPSRMLLIGGGGAAGAILVTSTVGANTTTITGGLLAGISSRDLVILQNNTAGDLQIDSRITSLNANQLGFTKSGLGTVLLTSNNTYSNQTFINEGKVVVTGDATTGNVQTLTTGSGSAIITGVDTTGLFIGQRVLSANTGATGAGTYIQSISGGTIVLSGNATASGSTSVTFGDSGALGTMTGASAVQVGAGAALQIGNGGGTGSLIAGQGIASSGTVIFNRSNAFTFSNTITGVGSVVQAGSGTTTLEGVQSYTGNTVVEGGTLLVNGAAAGSRAVVNSGARLGGSGTTGGITLNTGGKVTPGNSIGTLSTNNQDLVWNGEATSVAQMLFELDPGSNSSDLIDLGSGMFNKETGSFFVFDFLGTGGGGHTYTLLTFGSTDFSLGDFSYTNLGSGLSGSFALNANNLQFTVITAVPEPATILCGIFLFGFLVWKENKRLKTLLYRKNGHQKPGGAPGKAA